MRENRQYKPPMLIALLAPGADSLATSPSAAQTGDHIAFGNARRASYPIWLDLVTLEAGGAQ